MAGNQARARQIERETAKARRTSNGTGAKLLVMLAVVIAVIFGVAVFFKVNTIEVQGNQIYSAEQIVEASQIEVGDNLLILNKTTAAGNINAALPYVQGVSIVRSMPDGVIIQVTEMEASFAVMTDTNAAWLIGTNGKALERIETADVENHPQIIGVTIQAPATGQTVQSENESGLDIVLQIMHAFESSGILEHIKCINVEKEYDIVVEYEDRYEIRFGGSDDLDYKVRYLLSILAELSDYQAGVIDLTQADQKRATFQPIA